MIDPTRCPNCTSQLTGAAAAGVLVLEHGDDWLTVYSIAVSQLSGSRARAIALGPGRRQGIGLRCRRVAAIYEGAHEGQPSAVNHPRSCQLADAQVTSPAPSELSFRP